MIAVGSILKFITAGHGNALAVVRPLAIPMGIAISGVLRPEKLVERQR